MSNKDAKVTDSRDGAESVLLVSMRAPLEEASMHHGQTR